MSIAASFDSWQQHHFTDFLSSLQPTSHAKLLVILMIRASSFPLLWALTSPVAILEFLLHLPLLGVPWQFLLHLGIRALVARGHRGSSRCSHSIQQFPVLQMLMLRMAALHCRWASSCAFWTLAPAFDDFLLGERDNIHLVVVRGLLRRAGRVTFLISLFAFTVVSSVGLADKV